MRPNKNQSTINIKIIALSFFFLLFLVLVAWSSFSSPRPSSSPKSENHSDLSSSSTDPSSIDEEDQKKPSAPACPSLPSTPSCTKTPPSLANALKTRPGLSKSQRNCPPLESYHVTYDTRVHQADGLMETGMGDECKAVSDPRFSKCQLALKGFPSDIYDIEWDLIMVDAPTGYHDEAPGRMTAIYTAGLMARNRENGETDLFVHDVDRVVEDKFSKAFLCEGYLTEQEGEVKAFHHP
ncbi:GLUCURONOXYLAN 4-O-METHYLTRANSFERASE 2-RELATED [Salix koriyanagi]|uniref:GLUCURONOXYLAN 4-O-METHYLTRANSFERASE 2-RELATED n=1 Tax=Salix koriyanagi TaxID=2511006 RepID=A0A9Q0VZV8_9ROSI|nr:GLUCURONOXYLAN 4-O-METHYLTRANSFERASE 2-RELATED [Salix koriyanagi]